MRWIFIGLGVFGLVFVLMMVFAPTGGTWRAGEDPPPTPDWLKGLGSALSGFAPRVAEFTGGARMLDAEASGEASADIKADRKRDNRLLDLRLTFGGPARVTFRCARAQGSDCENETQTICLGALHHGDCDEQDEVSREGSFAIGKGGGRLTVIDDGGNGARVEIAD